ncbi:FxLD family lantipeptide [Lentzea xinjiangensis]|uniref:FxLD family lantipeptide n=1 Tax=Lentzea xinjiangensis TaxID=402600 RepID=A0A1H9W3H7_9PSEU|nr:FxLD family lanthipeptide [Lentzea xinjiangensis]SES28500.1 FxLD family lantipeptide [Lentzea xinjiangensis]
MSPTDFTLNVTLVDAGASPSAPTGDCTDDNCGSGNTASDACVTNG